MNFGQRMSDCERSPLCYSIFGRFRNLLDLQPMAWALSSAEMARLGPSGGEGFKMLDRVNFHPYAER
jgi:hypothetical protein